MLIGIISFIFVIGTGILIHELGHFIVARKFGILCHEFSIGMGPVLWKKRKGETQYTIRWIPLGGYVAMAGEDIEKEIVKIDQKVGIELDEHGLITKIYLNPESNPDLKVGTIKEVDLYQDLTMVLQFEDQEAVTYSVNKAATYVDLKTKAIQHIAPKDRCLEAKSKFARLATLTAGALMNFLLAFILVFLVGLRGEPILTSEIAEVAEGTPAYAAGLAAGDTIIEYNGYTITNRDDFFIAIGDTAGEATLTFTRGEETHQVEITPNMVENNGELVPQIGIIFANRFEFSLGYAVEFAVNQFKAGFSMIFLTFGMLSSGEAGVGDLAGPVGIAAMTTQIATQGIFPLLIFASLININLGLLNLLPIPALDGGRIVFVIIEAITRRPVNRKIEGYVHAIGMIFLFSLTIFITFNDIFRILR